MKGSYFVPRWGRFIKTEMTGVIYACLWKKAPSIPPHRCGELRWMDSDGHGLIRYEDGTIEWNYSTGGRWSESK
ncbi:MAG: hypothetical protein ACLRJV_14490 [Eubacteriales bacterium]